VRHAVCARAARVGYPKPGAGETDGRCARVLHLGVVVQRREHVDAVLLESARLADGASLRLSIVGIPADLRACDYMAPLSGVVTYEDIVARALADATAAARLTALAAPAAAVATYRCAEGWRCAWLLEELRRGSFDGVVLGGRPARRRDRRRLSQAAEAGGTAVLTLGATPRRTLVAGRVAAGLSGGAVVGAGVRPAG